MLSYDSGSQKPESVSLTTIKFFRAILLPEYGEALGENSRFCLFQLLEAAHISWLMTLPSISSKPATVGQVPTLHHSDLLFFLLLPLLRIALITLDLHG